jgi:hypothetical protein
METMANRQGGKYKMIQKNNPRNSETIASRAPHYYRYRVHRLSPEDRVEHWLQENN